MTTRRLCLNTLLSLSCLAGIGPCFALEAADLLHIKIGAVITVADPKGEAPLREITVTHVHPVRADGTVWYQINATSGAEQEEVLYADLNANPPKLETVLRKVILRKLVDRPRKFLDAVEDAEKGEMVMDEVTYRYNDKESDGGVFEPDGDKTKAFEFNYLVFTSTQDASLSIQVMRWSEDKFDTYLVRQMRPSDVKLKSKNLD